VATLALLLQVVSIPHQAATVCISELAMTAIKEEGKLQFGTASTCWAIEPRDDLRWVSEV
jgi:hypothetical protein